MPNLAVFSTSVEVFLMLMSKSSSCWRLLHVRGGVSIRGNLLTVRALSSPRPWRCFRVLSKFSSKRFVFSTSVEVFPNIEDESEDDTSLLHVRGGVSPLRRRVLLTAAVFSTSVEVFPVLLYMEGGRKCLLHVRGGVSLKHCRPSAESVSSPRPWRCFQSGRTD